MSVRKLARVTVYCGSNFGAGPAYRAAAAGLGQAIARRGATLVYGGTHKGLMGVIADAALEAGGSVHGVITQRLAARGQQHERLSNTEILPTMATRKARMSALADAVVALPGGIGTLEEFMEVWTLNQLGDLAVPTGLLDANGFYQPFLAFVDHMIAEGFLPAQHKSSLVVSADPEALLDGLERWQPMSSSKWMDEPKAKG
jgi:uncharacterized protein (TIGR00730 family)